MCDFSKFDRQKLKEEFLSAKPFNHIVIDNFFDQAILRFAEDELRNMPKENWLDSRHSGGINNEEDSIFQSKKMALNNPDQIKGLSKIVFDFFESKEMLEFVEDITGIHDILNDEYLLGAGIHKIEMGGHLAIHADFNIHPDTKKHRRINVLLYLNSDWKKEYNGELELWSKDMSTCVRKIEPVFNRLVLFRITDDAFHGHPEPWNAPESYPRLSYAFYYYTNDRPDNEKAPFHWAAWQKRNGDDY